MSPKKLFLVQADLAVNHAIEMQKGSWFGFIKVHVCKAKKVREFQLHWRNLVIKINEFK